MPQPQEFAADAIAGVARHQALALRLSCETVEQVRVAKETIAQSRALIAMVNAVLDRDTARTGCLWPAY
jgi:hypothetical protein